MLQTFSNLSFPVQKSSLRLIPAAETAVNTVENRCPLLYLQNNVYFHLHTLKSKGILAVCPAGEA